MPGNDENTGADFEFERALLDSARGDGPPAGAARAAWARFALGSGGLAALPGESGTEGMLSASLGSARAVALKWLTIGALGGSALTALCFDQLRAREAHQPAATAAAPPSATTTPVAVTSSSPHPEALASVEPALSEAAPPRVVAKRKGAATRDAAPAAQKPSLAEEVALLDAARTALGMGAFDQALQLVAQHRRKHPQGELLREGDVLAIEALVERGDRTEAALRARRFLESFPTDPHAARVRELTAR